MKESNYEKDFLTAFDKFSYRYSKWEVWKDFLYLSAASMANVVKTADWEEREATYLSTIKKYPKEYQELFPELFGLVTLALEENPEQDFLGTLYHRLHLEQEQKGQFFTPYHICEFMSEINFIDGSTEDGFEEKDYITVSDPACGAGAMLVAFANMVKKHNMNYQKKVLFIAQDVDQTAALMCYIQLSLLGCSAVVIIGDSLAKPGFHPDNDVWYTPMFYMNYWRFRDFFTVGAETDCTKKTADVIVEESEIKQYVEEAGGQLMLTLENAS